MSYLVVVSVLNDQLCESRKLVLDSNQVAINLDIKVPPQILLPDKFTKPTPGLLVPTERSGSFHMFQHSTKRLLS
jgi:hypothetical protein